MLGFAFPCLLSQTRTRLTAQRRWVHLLLSCTLGLIVEQWVRIVSMNWPGSLLPPPTPDSQLLLNAQRCQGSEERTLSALETLQASTGASSTLLQKLSALAADGLASDATHQAIVRAGPL